MKIAKVIHQGQTRCRVNDPSGPAGKRQRKFFETREAAEAYVKDRSTDKKEFALRFVTQPPAQRSGSFQRRRIHTHRNRPTSPPMTSPTCRPGALPPPKPQCGESCAKTWRKPSPTRVITLSHYIELTIVRSDANA